MILDMFQGCMLREATALRGYAAAQLLTFEKCDGWFFWTFRTETTPEWSLYDCVNMGVLPDLGRPEQVAGVERLLARSVGQAG